MVARYNRRWEEMDKTNIPLETLFETYALFNRSEGKSEETITWYDNKLHGFLRWLQENGSDGTLSDITVEQARAFVLYLQSKREKYERNPFTPTQTMPCRTAPSP